MKDDQKPPLGKRTGDSEEELLKADKKLNLLACNATRKTNPAGVDPPLPPRKAQGIVSVDHTAGNAVAGAHSQPSGGQKSSDREPEVVPANDDKAKSEHAGESSDSFGWVVLVGAVSLVFVAILLSVASSPTAKSRMEETTARPSAPLPSAASMSNGAEKSESAALGVTSLAIKSERLSSDAGRRQEKSTEITRDVVKLSQNRDELVQEMRENPPLDLNILFTDFRSNRIDTAVTGIYKGLFGRPIDQSSSASSVLIQAGSKIYSIIHIKNTPFRLAERGRGTDWQKIVGIISRPGGTVRFNSIEFLTADPRVMLIPLDESQVKRLGSRPYPTTNNPFRFTEAVLIGKDGEYYGETPFQVDPKTPQHVKMESSLIRRVIGGEFSPSTGDLVFSKTGELLGVMVNRQYCVVLNNFRTSSAINFNGNTTLKTGPRFEEMYRLYSRLPAEVQGHGALARVAPQRLALTNAIVQPTLPRSNEVQQVAATDKSGRIPDRPVPKQALVEPDPSANARVTQRDPAYSPKTLFERFLEKRVGFSFKGTYRKLLRNAHASNGGTSAIIHSGEKFFLLLHIDNTIFELAENGRGKTWKEIVGFASLLSTSLRIDHIAPLSSDPRVLLVEFDSGESDDLSLHSFDVAIKGSKVDRAVLIDDGGKFFGEVSLEHSSRFPDFARVSKIGSKSEDLDAQPSSGDFLFSKAGEVIGLMVDDHYCLLMFNFSTSAKISFNEDARSIRNQIKELSQRSTQLPPAISDETVRNEGSARSGDFATLQADPLVQAAAEARPAVVPVVSRDSYSLPPKRTEFSLGSTLQEVIDIQGVPESRSPSSRRLKYGFSSVRLDEDGRVEGWSESELDPLKVSVPVPSTSKRSISIGCTREEVIAIQGIPDDYSKGLTRFKYGFSNIRFDSAGRVIGWSESELNPLKLSVPVPSTSKRSISIGCTREEVIAIQGIPDDYSEGSTKFKYGFSSIQFDAAGKVKGWSESELNPLKVSVPVPLTSKRNVSVGCTREEVIAIQGIPDDYSEGSTKFKYGFSTIRFDGDGRVVGWKESDLNPLRVDR